MQKRARSKREFDGIKNHVYSVAHFRNLLVLRARLELARLTALASKTSAATNYAISA